MRNRQRGMTMWSAAFVIAVVVFFIFLAFKLMPPYAEDFKIKAALTSLASNPNIATMSHPEMVQALEKRFEIDNVTEVKANQLKVEKRGRNKVLRMRYESVVPLFYNVSALLDFDHAREVQSVE